jgi:hypothetical protein
MVDPRIANMRDAFGKGPPGLLAGSPQQQAAPTDMLDPKYAQFGKPDERYARAIEQQAAIRDQIFFPQYEKSLNFALDKGAAGRSGMQAANQASRYNRMSREQFVRMNERSQVAVDPAVQAENERLQAFGDAKNISNAFTTARDSTRDLQAEQLGEVTGLGVNTARQALGLSAGAATAYTDRQNRETQTQMAQAQANSAAQAANMQAVMSAVTSAVSIAVSAAIA